MSRGGRERGMHHTLPSTSISTDFVQWSGIRGDEVCAGALLHILSQVRSAMSAAVTLQQCCRSVAAINVRQSIVRYMRDALTFKLLYIEYLQRQTTFEQCTWMYSGKAKKKKGLPGALLHILSRQGLIVHWLSTQSGSYAFGVVWRTFAMCNRQAR